MAGGQWSVVGGHKRNNHRVTEDTEKNEYVGTWVCEAYCVMRDA